MSPSHVELTDFTGMDFALKKNCAWADGNYTTFGLPGQARGPCVISMILQPVMV